MYIYIYLLKQMNFFNLRLSQPPVMSIRDKELSDAKYNLFVNKDRYESARLRYIGDRELTNIQKDKIMRPQLERILKCYIKLLYTYDKYEPETVEIDKLVEEANRLQLRLYKCK
jgi:hypothetical protein